MQLERFILVEGLSSGWCFNYLGFGTRIARAVGVEGTKMLRCCPD